MSAISEIIGEQIERQVREKIAKEIEALPVEVSITNAVGMKMQAMAIARGK